MRDGHELTVLSLTQELPLFVYPELQLNVDDPLHVAFSGQDAHASPWRKYPELQLNVDDPPHVAFSGQDKQLPADK